MPELPEQSRLQPMDQIVRKDSVAYPEADANHAERGRVAHAERQRNSRREQHAPYEERRLHRFQPQLPFVAKLENGHSFAKLKQITAQDRHAFA